MYLNPYYRIPYFYPRYYYGYPYYGYPYYYGWGRPVSQNTTIKQDLKVDVIATSNSTVNVNINQLVTMNRPPARYF